MKKTRIFLLAGQSNMTGYGISAELPGFFRSHSSNVRLFEGGQMRDLFWRDRFGPEVGFAKEISEAPSHEKVVLCKVARDGANLYYDWNPDGVSKGPEDHYRGPLYPVLREAIRKLVSTFAAAGEAYEFAAMLWMQGERDSFIEIMANAYEKNLSAFVAAIRRETVVRDIPFLVGQISPRIYNIEEGRFQHAFLHTVQEAQEQVAQRDPMVNLIRTRDLPQSDNLHFDAGGQIELGKRFAREYLDLI